MVEKLGNMRAVCPCYLYIVFRDGKRLIVQLNMTSAEDYIVNNTREVVPGLITGGMELSGT
jgi:thiamine thiazole synthase